MAKSTTPDPFEDKRTPGEPPPEVKRDQWGRYLLPHPETGKLQAWTRATTFANTAADQYNIGLYNERLVAKGMAMRPDLYAEAASAHIDDKATLQKISNLAKEAAGGSAKARLGTALHTFTEKTDLNEKITIPAPWDADVKAYTAKLSEEKVEVLKEYIEATVIVPSLGVAGTLDRLIKIDGLDGIVVGDLKSGHSVQYAWMEIACQLFLYSRATHIYDHRTETLSEMPEVNQDKAIVIHLPVGDAECELYEINLELGARVAAACEVVRELRKRKNFSIPWEGSVSRAVALSGDDEPVSDDADWTDAEDVKVASDQQASQDAKADEDEWGDGPSAEATMAAQAAEDDAQAMQPADGWDEDEPPSAAQATAEKIALSDSWVAAGIDPEGKRFQRAKLAKSMYIAVDVTTGKHETFKLLREAKDRVAELDDTLVTPDSDVRPIGADEPAGSGDEWNEQEGEVRPASTPPSADDEQEKADEIALLKVELAKLRGEGGEESTPVAVKKAAVPGVKPTKESTKEQAKPAKRKWMAEVLEADSEDRLLKLYRKAKAAGEWNDKLTKAAATVKAKLLAAEAAEVDDDDNW